jgi:hypothetical protein
VGTQKWLYKNSIFTQASNISCMVFLSSLENQGFLQVFFSTLEITQFLKRNIEGSRNIYQTGYLLIKFQPPLFYCANFVVLNPKNVTFRAFLCLVHSCIPYSCISTDYNSQPPYIDRCFLFKGLLCPKNMWKTLYLSILHVLEKKIPFFNPFEQRTQFV